ncbi:hypothetical protein CF326_g6305 [Tilletia indica]|uniref:Glycoside hydrolase family 5 domain-containing protein n=1 Tax=Tilletia indica TaxID=43049 RepID=A0A177TA64_9BASI|nr:hypothetical protein CF326_g6305 [Tilletia indica]KAE8246693.1 hypothetical protein A4X13_0g5670 [Tilletia indica]
MQFFQWARLLRQATVAAVIVAVSAQSSGNSIRNEEDAQLSSRQLGTDSSSDVAVSGLLTSWKPPLSTRGRYVVDANGQRFRMQGGNWHGASGTYLGTGDYSNPNNHHAGEVSYQTVLCLDRVPIDEIVDSFLELGINTVRLPFSNQMIHDTTIVPDAALKANPQLRGMTALQIFDAAVTALTKKGIAVVLNNMTSKSLWCCGADQNSRWNSAQTTAQWQSDWLLMAKRYKGNKRVVGVDLYNEVRRDIVNDPTWGQGGNYDWWQASFDVANRILREANPDLLIVVEGINFVGIPLNGRPHGRPMLLPIRELSHTLAVQDKLVYGAHFYAYIGPNNTGADSGPFVTRDPLFRDFSASELNSSVTDLAGYVATALTETQSHYTAPVWISEFGVGGRADTVSKNRNWWRNFVQVMIDQDLDYAFWPLVGWHKYGLGDGWALHAWDQNGQRLSVLDEGDWRLSSWKRLQSTKNVRRGEIPVTPVWRMLAPDWGGAQQSTTISNDISWHPGNTRASCPDGLRLVGLSHGTVPRGLCTDATLGRSIWNYTSNPDVQYVSDERNVPHDGNWAPGHTKFQCASDAFVIGYSYTSSTGQSASAICAPISDIDGLTQRRPSGNRTVTFSTQDSVAVSHGTWAPTGTKVGACGDDELLIGFATDPSGIPSVLLCRTFNSTATVAVSKSGVMEETDGVLTLASVVRSAWIMTFCVLFFGAC